MKYKLIKNYKRNSGRILKSGNYIDVGMDKAKKLKDEGYIAKNSKPLNSEPEKPRKIWIEPKVEENKEENKESKDNKNSNNNNNKNKQ